MKYCAQCGREVLDTEVVCPSCGYTFEEAQTVSYPQESTIWATLSTIFSWLSIVISPIFGLVFSIIGMSKYKDPALKAKCKSGLIRTIVITVVGIVAIVVFYVLYIALIMAMVGGY